MSLSQRGADVARRLPYPAVVGDVAETIRARWTELDGFVLVMPATAATRIVGPLLESEGEGPSVVVVDDGARYAVPLTGDGAGRANDLARRVAAELGAHAVDLPAAEVTEVPDLRALPGLVAEGDVLGVTRAMEHGRRPLLVNALEWPVPWMLEGWAGDGPERIGITDELVPVRAGVALLRPPSLVMGLGIGPTTQAGAVWDLVIDALAEANLSRSSLAEIATVDTCASDPAITSIGIPVRSFSAEELGRVPVPHPSAVVKDAIGPPTVSEAAAFLASGPDGRLITARRSAGGAVVSIARRRPPTVVDLAAETV